MHPTVFDFGEYIIAVNASNCLMPLNSRIKACT